MFFCISLMGGDGGTAPEAFPTDTRVPFRLIIKKSESNLHQRFESSQNIRTIHSTHVSLPTPSKIAWTPSPFVSSSTRATVSSLLYKMT